MNTEGERIFCREHPSEENHEERDSHAFGGLRYANPTYGLWQATDRAILKRINLLIRDIGKPEPLKHPLSGFWSRRIDDTTDWCTPWKAVRY